MRNLEIDTQRERVVFIHERAVTQGELGFHPLDRVLVVGEDPDTGERREISGTLNFCRDSLVGADEIGLSDIAFRDLGLAEGASVRATLAPGPSSVDRVRRKLHGARLSAEDFDAILTDVVAHRYSKVELSMFVLACALRQLDNEELVDFAKSMIRCGQSLEFGSGPVADKHCIGGVPGNRTTLVVVPILAACGATVPKTSSRAITSPAGTADTMSVLADVVLRPDQIHRVVSATGGCITWGGALDLAPADDILITVERPMGIDTEAQMVASILAKKKTAGATHALIDLPVGPTTKVSTQADADRLAALFRGVAKALELDVDVLFTDASGPIGRGVGPRLEALDALSVLRAEPDAPQDLREKSLYLAGHLLEMVGIEGSGCGYRRAMQTLDSGAAARKLDEIIDVQGRVEMPPLAPHREPVCAMRDGRIRSFDCWGTAQVAKLAGAPASLAAGLRILRPIGSVVERGEPVFEIHAQSPSQLEFARDYALANPRIVTFGY